MQANVETFISHNGDFELFKISSKFYELVEIQDWLERVTYCKRPSNVDSAAIGGTYPRLAGDYVHLCVVA